MNLTIAMKLSLLLRKPHWINFVRSISNFIFEIRMNAADTSQSTSNDQKHTKSAFAVKKTNENSKNPKSSADLKYYVFIIDFLVFSLTSALLITCRCTHVHVSTCLMLIHRRCGLSSKL